MLRKSDQQHAVLMHHFGSSNVKPLSFHRFFVSECVPGIGGFNSVCRVAGGAMRGLWMVSTQIGE